MTTVGLCSLRAEMSNQELSARDIAPVRAVWGLSARSGLVGTNALIDIHTSSFRVPNATLREKVPVDVEFPDTRCIADDSRHDGEYEDLTDDGRG
jgi:hypothetical protein